MLHCTCLRGQRTEGKRDEMSSARKFGLISLAFIRKSVHVVHRLIMTALVDKGDD